MAKWKRIRKSDLSIIDGYDSNKKELQTGKFGGPDDDPTLVEHVQVPDGVDENGVKAIDQATPDKASASYEGVNYEASNTGAEGNNISLVFDGIDDIKTVVDAWNAANNNNQVTHDAGDETVVPSAGTVQLASGDAGGIALVADATTLDTYQKEENRNARMTEIQRLEKLSDAEIATELGHAQPSSHLMIVANNILVLLLDLQAQASIDTANLSQPAQDARAALVAAQSDLLGPIQTSIVTRNAGVANFMANSLPHPSAGLPADVDDYYSNL